ncbi:MAG: hypothetical protein KKB39_06390 [Nanoarchaeota archaeon]|nr:hypothetical protein [Nanoarchaeota archaeon]
MGRKQIFIILGMLLTLIAIAGLASANINDITILGTGIDKVAPGSVAEFKLTLYNEGNNRMTIDIAKDPFSTLSSSWFDYILVQPNRIELSGKEKKNINVTIKFKRKVPTGESYSTFIKIMPVGKPEESIKHTLVTRVVQPEEILTTTVNLPEKVNPGKKLEIDLNLENNLNVLLSEIEVYAASELFEKRESYKLLPLQIREETLEVEVPESAKPGNYDLNLRVYYDNQLVSKESLTFRVSTVSDVVVKTEEGKSFLKSWEKVTLTNLGNAAVEQIYDKELGFWQRMFASYSPEPTYTDSDGAHWRFSLAPNKEYNITTVVNFRTSLWIIIVIVSFGLFAYFSLTRGVSIKKEIINLKTDKEGKSEIRIMVHVKNRSSKQLKQVALIEVLPHHLHPKPHFGTLKPDRIQKGSQGIRLMWEIPAIDKHEERIITYNIETKVGVLGEVTLPTAMLRYKNKAGKILSSQSNPLKFLSGPKEIMRSRR